MASKMNGTCSRLDASIMDIEDNIITLQECDSIQRMLIDCLPSLDVTDVAEFIADTGKFNKDYYAHLEEMNKYGNLPIMRKTTIKLTPMHLNMAEDIIANKYGYFGSKDYAFCYLSMGNLDSYIKSCVNIACNVTDTPKAKINTFISLLYWSKLCSTSESPKYNSNGDWRCFINGLWEATNKPYICKMIRTRFYVNKIHELFAISSKDMDTHLANVSRYLDSSIVKENLLYIKFESQRDGKKKVFAFVDGACYDLKHRYTRIGLPSDLSTLHSNAKVDIDLWGEKRLAMYKEIKGWLNGDDVVDTYLDILAKALEEYYGRSALINSGSGADGKSSFFEVLEHVYGSYVGICPSCGPAIDSKANEATPLINSLMHKRLCLSSDVNDMVGLIKSAGFKSMSGGDAIYHRKMYSEAGTEISRLRVLIIVNTNTEEMTITEVHQVTRGKVIKWQNKRISDEDLRLIPSHNMPKHERSKSNYAEKFIEKYGNVFLTELIFRHYNMHNEKRNPVICDTILEWTRQTFQPINMLRFLRSCTTFGEIQTNKDLSDDLKQKLQLALEDIYDDNRSDCVSVQDLFLTYAQWRKFGARFSKTDPTDLHSFVSQLSFFVPIERGLDYEVVKNISLKGFDWASGTKKITSFFDDNAESNNKAPGKQEARFAIYE